MSHSWCLYSCCAYCIPFGSASCFLAGFAARRFTFAAACSEIAAYTHFFRDAQCATMPKRKLSIDEQLADLALRQSELNQARDRAIVVRCMNKTPSCVSLLVSTLKNNGHDVTPPKPGEKTISTDTGGPKSRSRAAQQERLERLRESSHAAAQKEMQQPENNDWIPSKYWTLDSLSQTLLIDKLLSFVQPFSLSPANLRSVKERGESMTTKENLCKLLEFETGKPGDTELHGPLRYWPYLQQLLKACSAQRGSRSANLKLPADWEAFGVYTVVVDRAELCITNRFTGHRAPVPRDKIPSCEDRSELYIDWNWSEVRATLKSRSDPASPGFRCSLALPDVVVGKDIVLPAPPRQALARGSTPKRLALSDGPANDIFGRGSPANLKSPARGSLALPPPGVVPAALRDAPRAGSAAGSSAQSAGTADRDEEDEDEEGEEEGEGEEEQQDEDPPPAPEAFITPRKKAPRTPGSGKSTGRGKRTDDTHDVPPPPPPES